jgi:hypothetical protein
VSRSPKYSIVRTSELIGKRLEKERLARERRREEDREKRAKAALEQARATLTRQVAAVAARCEALGRQPAATPAELATTREALERARWAIDAAVDDAGIAAAVRTLDVAERLRVTASTELLRRSTRHATGQLAAVRGLLAELDAEQRIRYEPAAAAAVDEAVATLAKALDHGDIAAFERHVEAVLTQVRAHHLAVTTRAAEHAERSWTAKATLDELAARLAGLTADAQAARTPLGSLKVAGEVLDAVRAELAADRPGEALALAERLAHRLDALEEELDTAIERLSARREMLGSIIEALPALGFAVNRASFVHGTDGSIGMQARRHRGEALMVVVEDDGPDDHRVNYLRDTTGPLDGRACASLKTLAEELNSSMRRNGFDPGSVTWDDDGHRPPPGARRTAVTRDDRRRSEP